MYRFFALTIAAALLNWSVIAQEDPYPAGTYLHYFDKDHLYSLRYGFVQHANIAIITLNCTNKVEPFGPNDFPNLLVPSPKPGILAYSIGFDDAGYDALVKYALTYCCKFGYACHHPKDFRCVTSRFESRASQSVQMPLTTITLA
ncbi:hypothetical protein FOZ61_000711 [Perkinsus olseni]|uniref:Chitin synthase, class 2 n=1 Tax=Perkinsus olseni TaxID=32597 RepID=A0A7J6MG49_PEROL|nr:hypothetical protein FOZ61_000711 [Perkinsus olseni]KAF4670543.1 hypothetical protein FOL46_000748 [Perkinsus olseni]